MLEIKDLSFSYHKRKIFTQLNVNFATDKLNIILGPNGTGKTTLLDSIAGLQTNDMAHSLIDFPGQKQLAYKLQQLHFFPSLTVKQTIQMYEEIDPVKQKSGITKTMKNIYDQILANIKDEKIGKLSGGEKQIVLNYCTCMLNRQLCIFDEPLSGVDINNAQLIIKMLSSIVLEKHKRVILTSHDIDLFKDAPTYIVVLNHQKCAFEGSYKNLLHATKEISINDALRKILV